MKPIIDAATWRAILFNEDGATRTFYENLRTHRFTSTRCTACRHTSYPPRPFCPRCQHQEVTWIDLPDCGTLYAFTTQSRSLRFPAPDVLGLIEFAESGGSFDRVFVLIDATLDTLEIGQHMMVGFHQISEEITVPCFRR